MAGAVYACTGSPYCRTMWSRKGLPSVCTMAFFPGLETSQSNRGYNFRTEQRTYGLMISHLQCTFIMSEYRPIVREVPPPCLLPNSKKEKALVEITTFDFSTLVHSLLSNPKVSTAKYLTIDPDHPFSEFPQIALGSSAIKLLNSVRVSNPLESLLRRN